MVTAFTTPRVVRYFRDFGLGLALITAAPAALAATYEVGPGKPYSDLKSVATKLAPGDVVLVSGGKTYAGGVRFTRSGTSSKPITIKGVRVSGNRPVLSGGTNTVDFSANHYVFEGFDITGGSSRCVFHHGHNITVRDSVIHDCPSHGILGADSDSGSLTLDYVEVYKCGSGTTRHPIYIATDESAHPGSVFRMQHCYVHDGNGGNAVKSRAERNEIYYNWIEGAKYRELELIGPDGQSTGLAREDSDVVGNVIRNTSGWYAVRMGGDGTGETFGRYRFVNNTFLVSSSKAVFQAFDGIQSVEMHNNVFFRVGGGGARILDDSNADWSTGKAIVAGRNNWISSGSTGVPSQWSGTLSGSNPGFQNIGSFNLRPTSTSPLKDAGSSSLSSASGYAFPSPLAAPLSQPPSRTLGAVGSAPARLVAGEIDIGAFEFGSPWAFGPEPDLDAQGEEEQIFDEQALDAADVDANMDADADADADVDVDEAASMSCAFGGRGVGGAAVPLALLGLFLSRRRRSA